MHSFHSLPTNRQPSLKVEVLWKAQRAASKLSTTYPLPLISGGCLIVNDPLATEAISLSCMKQLNAVYYNMGITRGLFSQ